MSTLTRTERPPVPRPLTKRDLDRQIETLAAELAARGDRSSVPEGGDLFPRPVSPAALVRLLAPFLSRN